MDSRFNRQPFSENAPLVARRSFTCLGVAYEKGQRFNAAGLDRHRLRQMWDKRMIEIDGGVATAEEAKPEHDHEKAEAKPEQAKEGKKALDAGKLSLKHVGGGFYVVVDAMGNRRTDTLSKEEAEEALALMNKGQVDDAGS